MIRAGGKQASQQESNGFRRSDVYENMVSVDPTVRKVGISSIRRSHKHYFCRSCLRINSISVDPAFRKVGITSMEVLEICFWLMTLCEEMLLAGERRPSDYFLFTRPMEKCIILLCGFAASAGVRSSERVRERTGLLL